MSIHPTIDNEQRTMVCGWVRVDGQWREIDKVYANIGGQWQEAFRGSPYYLYAPVGNKVVKLDYAGNLIWEYTDFADKVIQVAADPSGYVYAASYDKTVHKIKPDGTQAWKHTATDSLRVTAMAVGPDGSVYISGMDASIRKITSAGVQSWKLTDRIEGEDIAVTINGDAYVCGTRPSSESGVQLVTSSGTAYYFIPIAVNRLLPNVATDPNKNVYVSMRGPGENPGSIARYDSSGGSYYAYQDYFEGFTVYGPAIVPGNRMYAADRDGYLHKMKIDDNKARVWVKRIHNGAAGVWLDATPDGYIWVVGGSSLYKVDADGNKMFSLNLGVTIEKIASDPGLYGTFPAAWS